MKPVNLSPFMNRLLIVCLTLVTNLSIFGQTSISSIGTPVIQNFNSLANGGTNNPWTNNSTLPGWYVGLVVGSSGSTVTTPTTYTAADGTASGIKLFSVGSTGQSDRALGLIPGGATSAKSYYGWRLKNTTGSTIKTVRVSWYGEQWSHTPASAQDLKLFYSKGTTVTTLTTGTWTTTNSKFVTPKSFNSTTVAIDGNAAANRAEIVAFINIDLPNNNEVMLRWEDLNDLNNQLIALDDVSVVATSDQDVIFDPLDAVVYGAAPFQVTATATSGLPVTFESSNTNVATVTGNTVTIVGAGNVNITATQAGNSYYSPATFSNSLEVKPVAPVIEVATNLTSSRFKANWDASINGLTDQSAITYAVQYSQDPDFTTAETTNESTNNFITVDNLTPNSVYYYKIFAITDGLYSDFSESALVTTGTDYVSTANGTWDQNYWDVLTSPGSVANKVTVLHDVNLPVNTGRGDVVVNTLEIGPGASLNINQKITVAATLIIDVDKNDDAGQVLNNANIVMGSGSQIIVRRTFNNTRWHFVGFPFDVPVANIYLGGTNTNATWGDASNAAIPYKDFYVRRYNGVTRDRDGNLYYSESNFGGYWEDVTPKAFVAKKGYIVTVPGGNDVVIDFVSKASAATGIFSKSGSISVIKSTQNSFSGHRSWNLVTLPFTSSYDLAYATATPYYVYNYGKQLAGIQNYDIVVPGDSYNMQPYTSFFMQTSSGTLNFASAGSKVLVPSLRAYNDYDEVKLKLSNSNLYDITMVRLQEGASEDYVIDYDASKMFSESASMPQLYTKLSNGYPMALNTLPTTINAFDVTTKIGTTGEYTISLDGVDKLKNYSQVILKDNQTGALKDLLVGNYTFDVTQTGTSTRFSIMMTPNVSSGFSSNTDDKVNVIVKDEFFQIAGVENNIDINVYNVSGVKVASYHNVSSGALLPIKYEGLLLFEIVSGNKVMRVKSIVN